MSGASERSGAHEQSEQYGTRERESGASERASERMSEWPIINVPILRSLESLCRGGSDEGGSMVAIYSFPRGRTLLCMKKVLVVRGRVV